jgi:VIT1/CCC1 family predicted Fe2+/Mn2+ transporter
MTKFFFTLTFVVPVLFLPLFTAIIVSLVWGFSILTVLSYLIAKAQGKRPWKIIVEHVLIAIVVIAISHLVGDWVATLGTLT